MVIVGYRGGSSSGVSLTVETIVWHDVVVSNERLERSTMLEGESQSYKATVVDDAGNAIKSWFSVRLVAIDGGGNKTTLAEVSFAPDIYDSSTKEVTIAFNAPPVGDYTVKLEWDDQIEPY